MILESVIAALLLFTPGAGEPETDRPGASLPGMLDPAFRQRFLASYIAESDVEPRVTVDEREVLVEIMKLVTAEKLDQAAAMVEKQMGPGASAVFPYTLGNIRFQQERLPEAAAAYREAVDRFPRFRRAWNNLGQVQFRRGRYDEAVLPLSRVVETGGGTAVTYGLLGVALTHTRRNVSAESAFRMAVMLAPGVIDWKMGLAESLFRQGRFRAAASLFGGLIEAHPRRADLWLAQGEAFARGGQHLAAARNFEMAHSLGGATAACLVNLGDIYANQELPGLAVGAYRRAMARDPKTPPARFIRAARFLCAAGALPEARALVKAVETIHGAGLDRKGRIELLRLQARLALAAGAGDEEAKVLERIIELDPLDGDALILLGRQAGSKGCNEQAILYFERAAGIERFEADAKVRHAQLLVRLGRYKEALPLLKRSLELKPRESVEKYMEQVRRIAGSR